jgi:DNA-binding XRE family transcriptional regulator
MTTETHRAIRGARADATDRAGLEIEFAYEMIGWARQELELTQPELGQIVGADRKTIQRWSKRGSAPLAEHRRQLERLSQLRYLLGTVFRTPEVCRRWLHSPLPALKGRTPISVLIDGDLDGVLRILGTLASGAFR